MPFIEAIRKKASAATPVSANKPSVVKAEKIVVNRQEPEAGKGKTVYPEAKPENLHGHIRFDDLPVSAKPKSIEEIVAEAVFKALEARSTPTPSHDTPKPTKGRKVARKGNGEALAKWRANKAKADMIKLKAELAETKKQLEAMRNK